jgi:hypothetical protein
MIVPTKRQFHPTRLISPKGSGCCDSLGDCCRWRGLRNRSLAALPFLRQERDLRLACAAAGSVDVSCGVARVVCG